MFIPVLFFGFDSQWGNLSAPQPSRGPSAPFGTFIPWAGAWGGHLAGRCPFVPSTSNQHGLDHRLVLLSQGCVFLLFPLFSLLKAGRPLLTSRIPS